MAEVGSVLARPTATAAATLHLSGWAKYIVAPVAASALVALCAHISLPVPFTPVPTTMQTFAVLLIGILLGPAGGAIAMLLYLGEGAAGFPVFSPHGLGGLAQLSGPTAGYLLSYPIAAFVSGALFGRISRWLPAFAAAFAAALVAEIPVFGLGAVWLMNFLHLTSGAAIYAGVLPFLPAEALKLVLLGLVAAALGRAQDAR